MALLDRLISDHFLDCQCILLGRGGDDDAWMQWIRHEANEVTRVGSLVFTDAGVGYCEVAQMWTRGRLGREKLVPFDWIWQIPAERIVDARIDLVTVRGGVPYFAASIVLEDGEVVRFGLDWAPNMASITGQFLAYMAKEAQSETAQFSPQSDGAYMCPRYTDDGSHYGVLFHEEQAVMFSTNDVANRLKAHEQGERSFTRSPYQLEAGVATLVGGETMCRAKGGVVLFPAGRVPGVATNMPRGADVGMYLVFVPRDELLSGSWSYRTPPLLPSGFNTVSVSNGDTMEVEDFNLHD